MLRRVFSRAKGGIDVPTDVHSAELEVAGFPPSTGQLEFWDPAVRGFACRVSAGGVKSWVLAYRVNGRTRRWTLGRYPELSLTEARKRAQRALVDIADGKDPGSERYDQVHPRQGAAPGPAPLLRRRPDAPRCPRTPRTHCRS